MQIAETFRAGGISSPVVGYRMKPTPANHPVPVGWRILVQVPDLEEKTRSGLVVPHTVNENSKIKTTIGQVVQVGPLAYTRDDMVVGGAWCQPGQWVMFSLYGGQKFTMGDVEFRLMNDDEVLAVVPDPSAVQKR